MNIIRQSESEVKTWSGGTTTELFISPEGSSFSKGDFQLRISIATVEQDQTTFTPLTGTNRTLLVLKGSQLLMHQGAHTADLQALEQDHFSGDWTTECEGQSTNFNVMTMGSLRAKVTVRQFSTGESTLISNNFTFIYLYSGSATIGNQILSSEEGFSPDEDLEIRFNKPSVFIQVESL